MFLTISLLLGNFGCASEKLYVKVVDDEGCPVANAVVKVGVPPKTAFWVSPSRISKEVCGGPQKSIADIISGRSQCRHGRLYRWAERLA